MNILIGIIIVIFSGLLTFKANLIISTFGHIQWAERVLGTFGGSRMLIKLIGIFGVFVGFLVLTGQIDAFLDATLGWLVPEGNRNTL